MALSNDADIQGSRLLAMHDGAVQSIDGRSVGDVTIHSSSLLHAVSRVFGGTRYSLILFFAV